MKPKRKLPVKAKEIKEELIKNDISREEDKILKVLLNRKQNQTTFELEIIDPLYMKYDDGKNIGKDIEEKYKKALNNFDDNDGFFIERKVNELDHVSKYLYNGKFSATIYLSIK
jgi:hypothetical protein